MPDLIALGVEPGTVVSASWAAAYGPPPRLPGIGWAREPSGAWRAVAVAEGPRRVAPAAPVVIGKRRAAA